MLEVVNLTKIFKTNKKESKIALNNVSFKLPDKGCAFIVGKSGSGKTTLLSMIGGLDDVTSGEIIYHGNKLSEFKHNEYDVYRNNEVGFIFQDYHLLEELTIFDNVKMMLDFKNIKDDTLIHNALESVGLKGYENRYPKELSGGEKQRVAIARIIVKNPAIILADEPTGNLDQKTTKQILDLLKEISKEKLVLIVSHNKYDAYEYGDYILKLDDGEIKEKYLRKEQTKDNFRIEDNTLYLSKNRHITPLEINRLKESLKTNKIKDIKQNKTEFIPYEEDVEEVKSKLKNRKNHISLFNSIKYSFKFFKKDVLKSMVISLVLGIIISVCALCGFISNINEQDIRNNFLHDSKQTNFKISKDDHTEFVDEKLYLDILEKAKPSNIYKGYLHMNGSMGVSFKEFDESTISFSNSSLIYPVDEEFLIRTFGKDGKLEFIAKRKAELPDGFYVTDAFIDNLNKKVTTKEEYLEIVENGYDNKIDKFKVNGIIKTDINDRYADIFKKADRFNIDSIKNLNKGEQDLFLKYMNEMYLYHGAFYTYNDNFYNDMIDGSDEISVGLAVAHYKDSVTRLRRQFLCDYIYDLELKKDEVILRQSDYYELTGEFINVNKPVIFIEPTEIEIEFYEDNDQRMKNLITEKKIKVIGVDLHYNFASKETLKEIKNKFNMPKALFVEDVNDVEALNKINGENNARFSYLEEQSIEKIDTLVSSLKSFFIFVLIVLVVVVVALVLLYYIKLFNHNLFEIGVMKSLGARDKDVIHMMLVDFIFTLGLTIIFFLGLEIPLIKFSNKVLLEGIANVSSLILFNMKLKALFIDPAIIALISGIIFIVFFFAFILQFARIRRLKPINIIKAKE